MGLGTKDSMFLRKLPAMHYWVTMCTVQMQMEQLLIDCLLPGMCMVPALTALANEIWGAVNLLDCTDRWRIYTAWKVLPSQTSSTYTGSYQTICGILIVHAK